MDTMRYGKLVVGICSIAGLFAVVGCKQTEERGASLDGQNVLLITLDTTRADRIGCYGNEDAVTPALDSLAGRGLLFERAYSQVPMTTPSHCTLFTGRYPREHGVRNNGHTSLPDSFPTLATMFKDHGYATGAFVAAFVLDHSFGLARGFDEYNDDMGEEVFHKDRLEMEIRADQVTDRALAWLEGTPSRPFFCWVHYFDPHAPYDPPPEFAVAAANRYDGEINFVDSQVKRLLDWLEANDLMSKTLVVAVGDHGEAFGEHGDRGHGVFLYNESIHVPLIVAHPKLASRPRRIPGVVGVVDLFPTLAELFGFRVPDDLLSESFVSVLSGQDATPRASYSETLHGRDQYGWAEVRSLTLARWKYISTTRPELYDLEADPGERKNLVESHPDVASDMLNLLKQRYAKMIPGQATAVALNEAQRRGLESLGYVASAELPEIDEFLTPGLPDPKDRLEEREQIRTAQGLISRGQHAAAAALLEKVLEQSPNASWVHHALATCYVAMHRMQDARRELEKTIELSPTNWVALSGLGNIRVALGQYEEAVKVLRAAEALNGDDAQIQSKLGVALKKLGDPAGALEHFQRALATLFPQDARVYEQVATALRDRGLATEAVALYDDAVRRKPDHPQSRYELGVALIRVGQDDEAIKYLDEAFKAEPDLAPKLMQVARQQLDAGAVTETKRYLRVATKFDALRGPANYVLGDLAVKEGDTALAVEHFQAALETQPANGPTVAALSRVYLANHDVADAIGVMQRAVDAAPENVLLLMSLAQVLATAQNDKLRDGSRALQLATRAVELSQRKNPAALLALASALAETGDFDGAIETANEALGLLGSDPRDKALEQTIQTQVAHFAAGRPYRDPKF